MTKRLKDANDAILVSSGWCLEFDGSAQSVDFGTFYPTVDAPLGNCFYECWIKLLPGGGSGKYDWSAGYGGTHAMLRNPVNGNFTRASVITNATNASPIVVTTQENHGLVTGSTFLIHGVLGNTAANGDGQNITVLSPTTFSINGSTGNGAYTSGGVVVGPAGAGGSGVAEFGADDVPYAGQWAHSAVGTDEQTGGGKNAVMYYDGVPVGKLDYVGKRICANPAGGGFGQIGYMGGSDHSNFLGRIAQYRIFEGVNPRQAIVGIDTLVPLKAFVPEMGFGSQWGNPGSINASLLVDFGRPEQAVTDRSGGFPEGRPHVGKLKGYANGILSFKQTYPGPQYLIDENLPSGHNPAGQTQPAGKVYTPSAVPSGALVFDSIQRKNSTYAFNGLGGIGLTEGGSLGPLAWVERNIGLTGGQKAFGILNEQFVFLYDGADTFARVPIAATNLDIRVSRKTGILYGAGISTGIMFRYIDDLNFCFVMTEGAGVTSQSLFFAKVVAGAVSNIVGLTACPATNWEVLRVTTKSTGAYAVYCDATSVISGTSSQFATGASAGIMLGGNPATYSNGHNGAGLRFRARNFTVFDNP